MPTYPQLLEIIRYVHQALRRHRRKAVITFGVVAALALVGTLFMPRSYYSEARLFVRFGRENVVDPTAAGGQMVSIYESRESEINSLIEILKSRSILDRVVDQLGPQYILSGRGEPVTAASPEPLARPTLPEPPSGAHQQAIQALEQTVSVWAPRKSNIISVACKARSPEQAQRIVSAIVSAYLDEHVRVHRTAGSYQFFEDQTQVSLATWQKAGEQLRQAKNRLGIVTIDGKRKELQDQISNIASRLLGNQAELKTAEAKIASLEQLIEKLPEKVVTQSVAGANGAYDTMRQTLYSMEVHEQDLASKMQDTHPQLIAVRQQMKDLRAILAKQPSAQATEALNPSRQALALDLLNQQSQADALRGEGKSLAALEQQLHSELEQLNGQAVTIEHLEQQVALAEANHRQYAEKLELSRINRSLDEERISSLSLVQPASYVARAGGPRRLVVLGSGLMLAGLSAVGVALLAAWMNPVLARAEDLARLVDLPLAGVLPPELLRLSASV
jgi:uncharacterized protein involved in exopolysaccharide biosynthesis